LIERMNDWLLLATALIAGLVIGALYFGGLWLTVQRLADAPQPAFLALGSLAGRLALMLLGLYFFAGGQWARIGVYLLGFFIMRTVLVWRWGPQKQPVPEKGDIHGTQS
jgi:F1F0 ATPase subunit 2